MHVLINLGTHVLTIRLSTNYLLTAQVPIDGNGIACLVATRNGSAFDHWHASGAPSRKAFSDGEESFAEFMKTMHALVSKGPPLQCLDWDFKLLQQTFYYYQDKCLYKT